MIRRPPRSTRTDHSFPTRRSSDLLEVIMKDGSIVDTTTPLPTPQTYRWEKAQLYWADRQVATQELVRQRVKRSEEHTSELQSLMRISYAVFCLKKKKNKKQSIQQNNTYRNTTKNRHKPPLN